MYKKEERLFVITIRKGFWDREQTIRIIRKLRVTDNKVAKATAVNLALSAVPFDEATDDQLIAELEMQITILNSEILCDDTNEP